MSKNNVYIVSSSICHEVMGMYRLMTIGQNMTSESIK